MNSKKLTEDEIWLISFYRQSEINGAMFFGKLATIVNDPEIVCDLSKHFADESQHAWLWTKCLMDFGEVPVQIPFAYQDRYLKEAGIPTNIMEILALTQVFEQRVVKQYCLHLKNVEVRPEIKSVIENILDDEMWHIEWISSRLRELEEVYQKDVIVRTLQRYRKADQIVYDECIKENKARLERLSVA